MSTANPVPFPRRGELYDVTFEPVVGSELGKMRPAVVVSNDSNNRYARTVTVVPVTSSAPRRDYPFEVRLPRGVAGLKRDSRAKCDQVRTVDKSRVRVFRGTLPRDLQASVEQALKVHLALQ